MAAPPEKTIQSLTGIWAMNKKISDDFDPILCLQGVGWLARKTIGMAAVTLHLTQHIDDEGITHIDITQELTAGLKGSSEKRTLNWEWNDHQDNIFGHLRGRSRLVTADMIEDAALKDGFDEETVKGQMVETYAESYDNGWTANQIWGFEMIDGQRYYTRHVVCMKGDEEKRARLVYDCKG